MSAWLSIIGIGEDGVEGLSFAARRLLQGAELVVGGTRHLALGAKLITGARLAWPSPMADAFPAILARRGAPVTVLASGDPFCFGIGSTLAGLVPPEELRSLPAPSAFSLACARLGWALQDVTTLSFCGRPLAAILPRLQPGTRILALSADATTPAAVAALLAEHGFGRSRMHVLEALGGPRERIREGVTSDIDPLNLIAVEVVADPGARVMPLAPGLPDTWFAHDGQLTKAEVRAVTLAALAPRQGELLWDVGAGAGSVGIEFLLCHTSNRAIAIERDPMRAARIAANAQSLGVPRLCVVTGEAPEALAGLPTPDVVFIGGGGAIDAAWHALRPGGRIVANAVTVETEAALLAAHARHGGTLTRVGIERLEPVGRLHGFRPAMTVTQWAALRP